MDQALMEVRGLSSGHLFNDFELEEYITERLADYEYARAEMPASSIGRAPDDTTFLGETLC